MVGTPSYIAPRVLLKQEYNGKRVLSVQYSIPYFVQISSECRQLISRIFVFDPAESNDEIMQILSEATIPAAGTHLLGQFMAYSSDVDDDEDDMDSDFELDVDSSGEIVYAI